MCTLQIVHRVVYRMVIGLINMKTQFHVLNFSYKSLHSKYHKNADKRYFYFPFPGDKSFGLSMWPKFSGELFCPESKLTTPSDYD